MSPSITIDQALEQVIQFARAGQMAAAAELCRRILTVQPQHAVAGYLLEKLGIDGAALPGLARTFLDQAFRYPSHYFAVLPYNLAWMVSDLTPVRAFLETNRIVLADIGALGGSMAELTGLQPGIAYYGFDANPEECARLNNAPPTGFAEWRVFPWYVGNIEGPLEFHLYTSLGESSRYRPSPRFQRRFSKSLNIDRTITIEGSALDKIVDREGLTFPDIIKLDTQGTELEVLQAAPDCVSRALLIESEVEFTEIYDGQPLYHDVAHHLYERGFELLYLNRCFQNRSSYAGEARGQVTFGDALFGRREDKLDDLPAASLAKYVILLVNYGHRDFAFEIWSSRPDVRALIPDIEPWFVPWADDGTRRNHMEADKRMCQELTARRTNQLPIDSDRSWPIR